MFGISLELGREEGEREWEGERERAEDAPVFFAPSLAYQDSLKLRWLRQQQMPYKYRMQHENFRDSTSKSSAWL